VLTGVAPSVAARSNSFCRMVGANRDAKLPWMLHRPTKYARRWICEVQTIDSDQAMTLENWVGLYPAS